MRQPRFGSQTRHITSPSPTLIYQTSSMSGSSVHCLDIPFCVIVQTRRTDLLRRIASCARWRTGTLTVTPTRTKLSLRRECAGPLQRAGVYYGTMALDQSSSLTRPLKGGKLYWVG